MSLLASCSAPSPLLEMAAVLAGTGILVVCICAVARLMPCEKNVYATPSDTQAAKRT